MEPKFKTLAKKVNPKLIIYQDKIVKFKKTPIERYNPYQATKLPKLEQLKQYKNLAQVRDQMWDQVWAQVGDQVWAQVGDQMRDQVGDQMWAQVWDQVWDQVRAQVGAQVWAQVGDQVRDQVGATSYWGIKIALDLPIKHWFFDFLKLGVMIIFVKGKVKIFGKRGVFLGEYDEKDLK